MNPNLELLANLIPHFSLIHSSPGRIRVRVLPSIKEMKSHINLENFSDIDSIISKINGIQNVKFNKLIGSVTIIYDNSVFPEALWINLLNGVNLELISQKINQIAKDFDANRS
ncbi:hypothetical protein CIG1485E_1037 [Campylobacter iguaniorum]|uniref:Cation transporter n=1 Tax=Campylobacter iguaniorum TaxID=1244531 RepID=A0A076FB32_9BACT|nr:hypothetical protein [Campylobacter iguaniorum]AII14873.1 hypothetical protein CIG1485E_1037 [Campylobacter iguaniorum]